MILKYIFIVSLLVSTHAFAVTKVIFSNNSKHSYTIHSNLIDADSETNLILNRDYHTVENFFVDAYFSNQKALEFNSNVNIKNGKEYHFNVLVLDNNNPDQFLNFYITTKGLFSGSKIIETYVVLPSGERIVFDPKKQASFNIPNSNNLIFRFIPFARTDQTVSWPSFVLVIDKAYEDAFEFSQSNTLKILNYNVQLWPFYSDHTNPPNHRDERARRLPELINNNYDYVTLHEVFERGIRDKMIRDMREYYPYYVDAAGMSGINFLSSGVVTFSKWPILETKQMVYKNCHSLDCAANKGVSYIKIRKTENGTEQIYNIFSTHLQAWNNENETNAFEQSRAKQVRELKEFIEQQNIPISEPVLVAGDLNINKYSGVVAFYHSNDLETEYAYLLNTLEAIDPLQTGLTYSADFRINTMLGLSSYSTSRVDYVLYLKNHKVPTYAINDIRPIRDTENPKMYPIYDMSDHFPVVAEFVF